VTAAAAGTTLRSTRRPATLEGPGRGSTVDTPERERILLPDGVSVTFRRMGSGAPILAMPGGPGLDAAYLVAFAEGLTSDLTWYLVDPPGTGGTDPADDYGIDAHVRFYRAASTALGLGRHLVFGHSYSGVVATAFAATHPGAVTGMLVVAPPVIGTDVDTAEGGAIRAAMNAAMARHAQEAWYEDAVRAEFEPDPEDIEGSFLRGLPLYFAHPTSEVLRRATAALTPFTVNPEPFQWFYEREWASLDLRPLINGLEVPILAVTGEHDWAVPPIQARFFSAAPRATVAIIPDCGHFVPIEAAEMYEATVRSWLAALDLG
jgi:proline iminopeptidase